MIIKSYELNKFNYKETKNYLFYGNNLAQINQIIEEKIKPFIQIKYLIMKKMKF